MFYEYFGYIGALTIALQVGCAVHAIKTGRPWFWLWIIIIGSFVGCLIYAIVELLPDLHHSGGKTASRLAKTVNPRGDRKRLEDELALSDTVKNRLALADECVRTKDYARAVELFESCLTGIHKDDPKIMLSIAEAEFQLGAYVKTRDVLDQLIAANPDFRSPDGHLLYARALEELGETEGALEEYRELARYSGIEAKCRGALFLQRSGFADEAKAIFKDVVLSGKQFRHFYKGDDKRWIGVARDSLAKLGG